MFGFTIDDLRDSSCRTLIQLLKKKRDPAKAKLGIAQTSSERFSRTDMWKSVMAEITGARVVNGKHKNGSIFPVLLTSSAINVSGVQLYALLFEPVPKKSAVLTTDMDGTVLTCTYNIAEFLGVKSARVVGRLFGEFAEVDAALLHESLQEGIMGRYGEQAKHVVGVPKTVMNRAAEPRSIGESKDGRLQCVCVLTDELQCFRLSIRATTCL